MPLLPDPKHEAIVQAFVKGMGQLKAYNSVFSTKRTAPTASKFFAQPHIKERIKEVRELKAKLAEQRELESSAEAARKLGLTKTKVLQMLLFNAEACLRGVPIYDKDGKPTGTYTGIPTNPAAANQALKLMGMEAFGMFVERMEIGGAGDFARLTEEELAARIEADAAALGLSDDAVEEMRLITYQGDDKNSDDP